MQTVSELSILENVCGIPCSLILRNIIWYILKICSIKFSLTLLSFLLHFFALSHSLAQGSSLILKLIGYRLQWSLFLSFEPLSVYFEDVCEMTYLPLSQLSLLV